MHDCNTSPRWNSSLKIGLQEKDTQELLYTWLRLYLSHIEHLRLLTTNSIDTNPMIALISLLVTLLAYQYLIT